MRVVRLAATVLFFAVTIEASTFTVTNTNDSGAGSLRQAILDANANPGVDTIAFAIGSGPQTITPFSLLPAVTDYTAIDATTQPGYAGVPLIQLDGSLIVGSAFTATGGLILNGPSSVVGLSITSFRVPNFSDGHEGCGIIVLAPNCIVKRCYLGVSRDGHTAMANDAGIRLESTGTTIGAPGEGNVISGNASDGVVQWNFQSGSNCIVQNNYIGLDASGLQPVPNVYGMYLASGNTVTNNVVAGNRYGDAYLTGSGTVARGNKFGVNVAGTAMPFDSVEATVMLYNGFGNNASVVFGGPNPGDGNEVASSAWGVYVSGLSGSVVQGNNIHDCGIGVSVSQSTSIQIAGNTIHNNFGVAVQISSGARNTISANSIYSNGGGIELGSFIPVLNDAGDGDGGPNLQQNFPVITGVRSSGGTTTIDGTLNSTPNASFVIELFNNAGCDASGYGEGKTYLGSTNVTTDGSGNASFSTSFGVTLASGTIVAATATDSFGDTSQFSQCFIVAGAGLLRFATTATSLLENAGSATVTVQRANGSIGAITVDYATHDGSATAGSDYVMTSGTLTFADGETSKTIGIPIVNDTIPELTEQFTITLSNPTGGAILGNPSSETISILDDDPIVASIDDVTITEGNAGTKNATFTVSLNAPWNSIYAYFFVYTQDGTARSGRDYGFYNNNIIFSAGDRTKTVQIPIFGNTVPEPNKQFTVNLSFSFSCCSSVPVTIAKSKGTCTIVNDDHAVAAYSQQIAVGQTGTVTLLLGQGPATDDAITVTSSAPNVVSVASSVRLPAGVGTIALPITAKSVGSASITATLPASLGGGILQSAVTVYDGNAVTFSPTYVSLPAGTTANVTVSLQPAQSAPQTINLATGDPTIATVPAAVLIPAGESATFIVTGLKRGGTSIAATTPLAPQALTIPVDVTDAATGMTITAIAPANGPVAGGTPVTITGTNFGAACSVLFSGIAAIVGTGTSTSLAATTPAHAEGPADVTVSCGASSATLANGFTYIGSGRSLSSINPSFGSTSGGTIVRLTGDGFTTRCWPYFGTAGGRDATIVSSKEIIVTTPAHAAASVDVSVRCSDSQPSTLTSAFAFTNGEDPAPVVTSVSPLSGSAGQPITIGGVRFRTNDKITFDTTPAVVLSTAPDTHVVTVPELPLGKVSVNVTDAGGRTSTTGPIFTVLEGIPPRITGVVPSRVAPGGELTITGSGFRPSYSFALDTTKLATISVTYTRAVVRLPMSMAADVYPLDVLNAAGQVAAIGDSITVVANAPRITNIVPSCATADGGLTIRVIGNGFVSGATVTIGGVAATQVSVVNANTISATVPAGDPGKALVLVTNPDGTTASLSYGFRYASPYDPDGCAPRSHAAGH